MKKLVLLIVMINVIVGLLSFDKYAGEIYEIPVGVRNIALGNTGLTDVKGYSPAYWNPALLPELERSTLELMHAKEFDGLFKYDSFSFYYHAQNSIAISLTRISINDIPLTKLENGQLPLSNDNRPYAYKFVDNNDYLLNIALGRKITSRLNMGITPKITYRQLAEESAWAIGADLGFLYKISSDFVLAGKINNVIATHILWENGSYELASPKGELEFRYDLGLWREKLLLEFIMRSDIYLFADSDIGDYDLAFTSLSNHYGLAITPFPNISVLTGYDVDSLTAGIDLKYRDFSLFYAYKNNSKGDLGNSQKISLGYQF
ncbi:hypothetical protein JEZ13_11745 [bacterium]|nr:hypothetical protein [bacterium]